MPASLDSLYPDLRDAARELVNACAAAGLNPQITSTLRSQAEQKTLYDRFISGRWPYPVAKPGTSAHEFGWAFDMVVTPYETLNVIGPIWESVGGVWGGRYNDPIHFQYPGFKPPPARPMAQDAPFIAKALDFILAFNPAIGTAELVAWLLSLGFPKSTVLEAIQNPIQHIW